MASKRKSGIKIDEADMLFSFYIRSRDNWTCQRCKRRFGVPTESDKNRSGLHNSHYYGRGKESVRFHPNNCDALCHGCHVIWGSRDREHYRAFKLKQLGQDGFDLLFWQSQQLTKRDRAMAALRAREYLRGLPAEQVPTFIREKYLQ